MNVAITSMIVFTGTAKNKEKLDSNSEPSYPKSTEQFMMCNKMDLTFKLRKKLEMKTRMRDIILKNELKRS